MKIDKIPIIFTSLYRYNLVNILYVGTVGHDNYLLDNECYIILFIVITRKITFKLFNSFYNLIV